MPILIPVVGAHDIRTKQIILQRSGAVQLHSFSQRALAAMAAEIWPGKNTVIITDKYGNQKLDWPWLTPIDLGDEVKLGFGEFLDMADGQFDGPRLVTRDELQTYLGQLLDKDVEVLKFFKKMQKLS